MNVQKCPTYRISSFSGLFSWPLGNKETNDISSVLYLVKAECTQMNHVQHNKLAQDAVKENQRLIVVPK